MKKSLLWQLHNDILKGEGYYNIYVFIAIIVFTISIENIKPVIQMFRTMLIILPLIILVVVYIKFKNLRKKEEDLRIKRHMLFFALLSFISVFKFIIDHLI